MWAKRIQYLNENFSRISKRDRIFLNNPVIMSGLGLAPLVVVATNGRNAVLLSVAVLLMLTPTRVLASFVSRWVRFRALAYCLCAAVVYMGAYLCMQQWFDVQVVLLGIYLPMLVVEPIIIKRYERATPEKWLTALRKGLLTTGGYVLVILLVGMPRELLAAGTVFGKEITPITLLPMASLPSGGFVVVALLCAVWRGVINMLKKRLNMEAKRYQ